LRIPSSKQASAFRKRLLGWFSQHGRTFPWRRSGAPIYDQVIAELLLQRTRAETVASRLPTLLSLTPDWSILASTPEKEMEIALKPLGLWRRRASSLRRLAVEVSGAGGALPKTREALEQLPGVGQYMASAILVIQDVQPAPYLDTNMARVLERHFGPRDLSDIRYDPALQRVAHKVTNSRHTRAINWAILDFSAIVCKLRNPTCPSCPVRRTCDYYRSSEFKS
jgi:A/G-specific adenine glycosylase